MSIFLVILLGSVALFALMHAFGGDGNDGLMHDGDMASDLINIRNMIIFGVGFGAAGFIAERLGQNGLFSSFWGLGFGVLMVVAAVAFYGSLRKQESNSLADHHTLVGRQANVTTDIPASGLGEVSTSNQHGGVVNLTAKSQDGAHKAGSVVSIVAIVGNVATVKTVASNA